MDGQSITPPQNLLKNRFGNSGKRDKRIAIMTNNSRERIFKRLRVAKRPFPAAQPITNYLPMSPIDDQSQSSLTQRFVKEAEALSSIVHQPATEMEAINGILSLLGEDKLILAWEFDQIPLAGLKEALQKRGIELSPDDPTAKVGISGADAALAATGSLVLFSGNGRYRPTTLLPTTHIAIIKEDQILPNLESWVAQEREQNQLNAFKESSNVVIISGSSRTADIALELILGMHGPGEMHIFIMPA